MHLQVSILHIIFIAYLYRPILIVAGEPPMLLADGGFKDRTGIRDWAVWASATADEPRNAIVHLVGTSSKKQQRTEIG
jgi:hypothetical protein